MGLIPGTVTQLEPLESGPAPGNRSLRLLREAGAVTGLAQSRNSQPPKRLPPRDWQREARPPPALRHSPETAPAWSSCCPLVAAVQSCCSCGAYGGGQGSRPVHFCTGLGKSPSRELGHCVASSRQETREMARESAGRHRSKSRALSRLHLFLRASRALGPDVCRHWKASDCRCLERSHPLESTRTRVETRASRIPPCPPWTSPRPRSENFTPPLPGHLPERSPFGLGS